MRIAQAWLGIRDRWSRADSSGVSVGDLVPVVQPVVMVGHDEADASGLRAVFLQTDTPDREVAIVANTVWIRVIRVAFENVSATPQAMFGGVARRSVPEADVFGGARQLLRSEGDARFREGTSPVSGFLFMRALAAGTMSPYFELGLILRPGEAFVHRNPDAVESGLFVQWTEYG